MLRRLLETPEIPAEGTPLRSRPDETIVGFGRYDNLMYKEVPQQYLDWIMEVVEEVPTECSYLMTRLATWARHQRDFQMAVHQNRPLSAVEEEPESAQPACEVCRAEVEMVYACFFCRKKTCMQCLRPAPGMLPMCTICWGVRTRPALSKPEALWATRLEGFVDNLMSNILNLGSAMIQHQMHLDVRPRRVNVNTPHMRPEGDQGQHNASMPAIGRTASSSTDIATDVWQADEAEPV